VHARDEDRVALTYGGTSAIFELFADDADAAYQRAMDACASAGFRPDDSFHGPLRSQMAGDG
jgi:hypothetical protein